MNTEEFSKNTVFNLMNIMSGIDPESRPFRAETWANGEPRALPWAIAYGPFGAEDGLPADGVRVGMSCVDVVCVIGP